MAFKLSPEQEKVIADRSGHLQVMACAGAGKTEAISRRISTLIEEGVEPEQIVAFTFTERAAESLRTRITKRIADVKGQSFLDRLGPMFVGTIHAYCLRLLQDHVPEFGNFDILDTNRLAGLLSREHRRLELSKIGTKHWRPIFDFLRNADVVENEQIDPQSLTGTPFGDCFLRFQETLNRYHFLTYGQLISAAIQALQDAHTFERVHRNLIHLVVDEYQDINPAQETLISLLSQPPVNLCVVGDDDQATLLDASDLVKFHARNDHVGLVIPYEYLGVDHSYEPDFLVRLINDVTLILEIKGYEVHGKEQNNAKHNAAKKWVAAVNNLGDFGQWDFLVCRDLDTLLPMMAELLDMETTAVSVKKEGDLF